MNIDIIGGKLLSKIISILISILLISNVFGAIAQNVGTIHQNIDPIEEFLLPKVYSKNPQNEEFSNSSQGIGSQSSKVYTPNQQNNEQCNPTFGGSGGLADSPWPMFRQNLNHTGLSPYDTSSNNGNLKWSFLTDGGVYSSPAIDHYGTIYVGSGDNKLYAINSDGTEKWNYKTNGPVESSPTINTDGTIYVGSWDNNLYAINPDGTEKWSFTTGNKVHSSPSIGPDGTIYIGSHDDKLYAINPNGSEKWNFRTNGNVESSPAIGFDGTIYVGSIDSKLYAIYSNGTEKWNFPTNNGILSSPAIGSDGTIYIGSIDSMVYAINPNGTEKWRFVTGSNIYSSPAIGLDGTIYIGSHDNNLYAINLDGTERWRFKTKGVVHSSPAIGFDGSIYVGSSDDKLYAINSDGTEKWNYNSSGNITGYGNVESSPTIGFDGTIYVGSWEYQLHAIGSGGTPPIADAFSNQIINEGDIIQFDGLASFDPDGTIETYDWDFDANDGLWWETGAIPDAIDPTPTHIYGDDGIYVVTLRVTDNDNLSSTDTKNITVHNVNPTITIESITMNIEIGLGIAGRKYNNVNMALYEDGNQLGYASIERLPGSPDEQIIWIPISINFSKFYNATITYTPEDPPNLGGNPVWIYLKSNNNNVKKIHHIFNVQQSKKRDSDHWNHIEPWKVDFNSHLIGLEFKADYHVTDPGSDDEFINFIYGSQNVIISYFNNPPASDPYPSPELNPMDIYGSMIMIYEGVGTLVLHVEDDDNIRMGEIQSSESITLL